MNKKQRGTLQNIFARPTRQNIRWTDVESMFRSLGAHIEERSGSRVAVELNDVAAVFHRPHPDPEIKTYVVLALRKFLESAGINR